MYIRYQHYTYRHLRTHVIHVYIHISFTHVYIHILFTDIYIHITFTHTHTYTRDPNSHMEHSLLRVGGRENTNTVLSLTKKTFKNAFTKTLIRALNSTSNTFTSKNSVGKYHCLLLFLVSSFPFTSFYHLS